MWVVFIEASNPFQSTELVLSHSHTGYEFIIRIKYQRFNWNLHLGNNCSASKILQNSRRKNICSRLLWRASWNRRKPDCKMGARSASALLRAALAKAAPRRTLSRTYWFIAHFSACVGVCSPCGFARRPAPCWTSSWCWLVVGRAEITREAKSSGWAKKCLCCGGGRVEAVRRRTSPARTHCTLHWDQKRVTGRPSSSARQRSTCWTAGDARTQGRTERKMLASLLLPGN